MDVTIENADMLDAIAASRKHFNSDKNPDQQFATDEEYAQALVSYALKQQLGIRDEPKEGDKTETFADQLQRQRDSGVLVKAPAKDAGAATTSASSTSSRTPPPTQQSSASSQHASPPSSAPQHSTTDRTK